jgi:hypothetical protein
MKKVLSILSTLLLALTTLTVVSESAQAVTLYQTCIAQAAGTGQNIVCNAWLYGDMGSDQASFDAQQAQVQNAKDYIHNHGWQVYVIGYQNTNRNYGSVGETIVWWKQDDCTLNSGSSGPSSMPNAQVNWNDRVSSFDQYSETNCAFYMFENTNFGGRAWLYDAGSRTVNVMPVITYSGGGGTLNWNDALSSLKALCYC